jgi:hypothetical protein
MQTALQPVSLNETRVIAELIIWDFLTVGIPVDEDQLLVTDPANWAFNFCPADGDFGILRNVVMFRISCFHMPLCKVQTCRNNNNNNNNIFRVFQNM